LSPLLRRFCRGDVRIPWVARSISVRQSVTVTLSANRPNDDLFPQAQPGANDIHTQWQRWMTTSGCSLLQNVAAGAKLRVEAPGVQLRLVGALGVGIQHRRWPKRRLYGPLLSAAAVCACRGRAWQIP